MKEKVIDFSNGIFTYEQAELKIEPPELLLELEEGQSVQGSIVVSSGDERRIKGILYDRIPGLTLLSRSFFGRAARLEYICHADRLRPGETYEDRIWLETSAGEYSVPVRIQIKDIAAEKEQEEEALLPVPEMDRGKLELHMGHGRRESWKHKRKETELLLELSVWLEKENRNGCSASEAAGQYRALVDQLKELDPESAVYPLLDAGVMLREGRREEAGWILRKYEKSRLFQQRELVPRALFLYVNSLFRNEEEVTASAVAQLQKLYSRHPENWMLTWFLLQLDPQLKENARTRYLVLEKQFHSGTRNRLLYQEAWNLLRDDTALFTKLDACTLQVFGWASAHGFLTAEIAELIAGQAVRLKRWSPLASHLLKACYQVSPSRETAGAVCGIYIRGHRTDEEAFVWYQKGVELDAKITNLYEYFMYSLPVSYAQLLPRQIILYFTYHNTLTSRQKTAFYCNLVRFGALKEPEYEGHRRQLQEFLLQQLKARRINESLAWLYGRCLLVEALEKDMLEALADLLFIRKITCKEKRIKQVEVSYDQLEQSYTVPLVGGCACIPVYTPGVKINLLDERGKHYRQTVSYEMKRLMIEPRFLQECTIHLKDHLGLNLYLLDGNGGHRLNHENVEIAWRLLADPHIREEYRRQLKLELLEYERRHHRTEKLDERLRIQNVSALSREGQASYIEYFILLRKDEEAFDMLRETGCRTVDSRLLLQLIARLLAEGSVSESQLLPYAHQVYAKGYYTERVIGMLARECEGSTEELLALWKAGERFGLDLPELEEQLVVQSLFTERYLKEVFPVFRSIEDRGGDPVLVSAWLNYLSWLDFVKGQEVPEGLFDSLEHHLIWEDRLAEVSRLAYLKQLSVLLLLTDTQKKLANQLVKDLGMKAGRFAFLKNLPLHTDESDRPDDQVVVEYRCNPDHKVVLHYVLEYHGRKTFDYVTEQLFPICGGIFTRSFILFYGERLTWFFREELDDGTTISTVSKTIENRAEPTKGGNRYQRLCSMQYALDRKQESALKRMMREYEELTTLSEERFRKK